jgi:tert-butyl alcohol monooxygenase / tert-amyl alcohol desaturase
MRSAYGRQTPPPEYKLTCVEPGSPMGELLRRYWQPVCKSDELRDLPKKVKLLCEEPGDLHGPLEVGRAP